ncbi:uncharacterized protein LOC131676211 [Topomyia yanbarensis]|uniref:uncharacterized protein LOC131676211 n=1 Tax=Topomyia yanbarensis TaxID=2498891 RepID=UPI00273C00DD|nr:uncharacterized protein LOC131676211 [Topomyia yanbarensis]
MWIWLLPSLLPVIPALLTSGFNISEPTSTESPLTDAAVTVITQFFEANSNQLYIRRRANDPRSAFLQRDIINQILLQIQSRIAVQVETNLTELPDQPRAHNVFLVDDYEAFKLISNGMKVRTYDYTGWFLVIVSDTSGNSYHTVQEIMDDLWSHYIVNVGVLMMYDDSPDKAYYYTYFPFGHGYCEDVRPWLWKVFVNGQSTSPAKELFPAKLMNLHGCPLKLATFDIPPFMMLRYGADGRLQQLDGLDGIVTRVLSQRLNFTLDVTIVDPPEWGITAKLGHCTGTSRYVRDRIVNFTIGYWSVTLGRNRFMASTFPYYTSLMSIIAPPGEPYTSLDQLRLPFEYIIWCCVVTILVIAVAVIVIIHFQMPTVQNFVFGQAITTPTLNTFNIFFGGALSRLPARNFSRTMLAFWLLYGIIIRTSYTAALFKFLQLQPNKTVPQFIPQYIAADYQVRMGRNYSYVFEAFPEVFPYLKQTTLQEFIYNEVEELQHPNTRYVVLAPIETISYLNRILTKRGQILRVTSDRVYLSKLAIYTQRSAPILHPFNHLLGHLYAAGLIDQWASKYHQPVFLREPTALDGPRKLSVAQVLGCFQLLAVGLIVSLLVFGMECAVGYRERRARRRKRQGSDCTKRERSFPSCMESKTYGEPKVQIQTLSIKCGPGKVIRMRNPLKTTSYKNESVLHDSQQISESVMRTSVPLIFSLFAVSLGMRNLLTGSESRALENITVTILLQAFQDPFESALITQRAVSAHNEELQADLVNDVIKQLNDSVTVRLDDVSSEAFQRSWTRNAFFVDSYEAFEELYQEFSIEKYDSSGKFLIVFSGQVNDLVALAVFKDLWRLQIINVVLVGNTDRVTRLWSYDPYRQGSCGVVNLISVDAAVHIDDYYSDKIRTFHGCTFKVGSFETRPYTIMDRSDKLNLRMSGFEGDLLDVLKETLNFKVKIIEPPNGEQWGYALKHNSTGIMRMIQEEEVDFGISCLGISVARNEILKPGIVHYTTSLVLAVPGGRPYTAFEKLFQPFKVQVWFLTGLAVVLAMIVITFVESRNRSIRYFVYGNKIRTPYLNLVQVFFGISMHLTPARNFAKTLLFLWIYLSIILRSLYQGAMFNYLQQESKWPPSQTLAEIDQTEAFYYVVESGERYYEAFPNRYRRVRHLPQERNNIIKHLKWMMHNPQSRDVTMGALDHMAHHNFLYRRYGGFLPICREFISTFTVAIYYPKKSILTKRFDAQIQQIQAAGLMSYWITRYGDYDFFRRTKKGSELKRLSNEHLFVAYKMGGIMLTVSGFVFGLELVSGKIRGLRMVLDRFSGMGDSRE